MNLEWYDAHAVSYCNWEIHPPATDPVRLRQVVDYFDLIDVLGEDQGKLAWAKYTEKYLGEDIPDFGTLLNLWGPPETIKLYLYRWITSLSHRLRDVSGDDTFYDYFPNEVMLVKEFTQASKDPMLIRLFNRLMHNVQNHPSSPYRDADDSPFIGWAPLA